MQPNIRVGLSFDDLLLVPQRTAVRSRRDVDTSVTLTPEIRLTVPIISANTQWCTGARLAIAIARLGGLGFVHRMQTVAQQAAQIAEVKDVAITDGSDRAATVDRAGRLMVGGSVGVTGDYLDRAATLVDQGADLLLVDVAHGHSDAVLETVGQLASKFPNTPLVAGNVATPAGTRDLIDAGAHVVKVGIGPGGVCTTRLVAGSGVPQMTAIFDCAAEAQRQGASIIADGGVRHSGDIAKALAGGATAVMLGSLLAGCDESEAVPNPNGTHKMSRGFATLGMANSLRQAAGERLTPEQVREYVPEGVESTFVATGSAADTLAQLVGGLRSAMSYSGANGVSEFQSQAEFIQVTAAGRAENEPHALRRAPVAAPNYRDGVTSS